MTIRKKSTAHSQGSLFMVRMHSIQDPPSYTKLGHGGTVLADDALHVDDGGPWIMTRDNVTDLIWEIKTNASRYDRYSWSNALKILISQLNAQNFGGFSDWRLPTGAIFTGKQRQYKSGNRYVMVSPNSVVRLLLVVYTR